MIETKSPLSKDENEVEVIKRPDYSEKEEVYLRGLRKRMETARNNRDTSHDEFDGMDFLTYYIKNERLANTYVEPKLNKEDSNFQSGTIRTKLFALLSSIVNLDLSGDISALDKNNMKVQILGDAMEDIMLKTSELDNDDEKKLLRQYELLKHGTVFVEEVWDERSKKKKKMEGKFSGKLDVSWKTKIKKAFAKPSRNIVPGINVYLGDISKYNICDQPFIFTVDTMPYSEAELVFGEWDRWENVPKDRAPFDAGNETGTWQLLDTEKDYVEILRYQNKWDNEFALVINGVLMTPPGLPLPWGYEDYNIAQQNLEPIHSKFAYGKSLVFRIRNKVAILDEFLRLGILKTQKSFVPPKFVLTGRVLSNRAFFPGKINYGVDPRMIMNADDKEVQGVTTAELAMIEEVRGSIDSETTSPTFQGQQSEGNPTATEIVELQRQAKQMLGLTIFSVSMLEWKLEWLRLQNLLANWFRPEDSIVDELRGEVKNKYRQTSVARPIEGEGMGMRQVIPTEQGIPSPYAIRDAEDILSEEQGMPVRLIFLDPEEVTSSKLCWQITIRPREKRTSETDKLMFRAFLGDVSSLQPNIQELQQEFSSVWGKNPQKLFAPNPIPMMPAEGGEGTLSPRVNLPSPEKSAGRAVRQTLGVGV